MNNYLSGFRVKNPLETEVETYLTVIENNLNKGQYSPDLTRCIADANLVYIYSSGIIPMNSPDNKVIREFRDNVKKIALNGITCEEIYSIVDSLEKRIY